MLPRSRRVDVPLFKQILLKGQPRHSAHLSLYIIKTDPAKVSRFSFVVPKKVEKTAVGRNKIKRRAAVIMRKEITTIRPGVAGVFTAKAGIQTLSSFELGKEIAGLFLPFKK